MYLVKGHKKMWYVRYQNPLTNKWTMLSTKTKNKSEATQTLLKMKQRIAMPDEYEKEINFRKWTIQHLIDKYLSVYNKGKYNQIIPTFRNFVSSIPNGSYQTMLYSIKNIHIENFKLYRSNMNVALATVNLDIRCMKAVFNKAIEWEMMKTNPVKGIKQFVVPEKKKYIFDDVDIKKVCNVIKNETHRNIFMFAIHSGCRMNEILNLEWNDIDFEEEIISIQNKKDFNTKSKRNRFIPFSSKLRDFLYQIRNNQLEPKGYVFFHKNPKNKYAQIYMSHIFRGYFNEAGIERSLNFHSTRHTFCSNVMSKNGGNLEFSRRLLGHSDIKTTLGYTHVLLNDLREAMQQIG